MNDQSWTEQNSQHFIDYAACFVPDRAAQLETICALIPALAEPFHVVELCCGAGLLARTILERHPRCHVHAFDGSSVMLDQARASGGRFRGRCKPSSRR